jgi:hypothetical protein
VQRPPNAARAALGIERIRDLERTRIQRDERVQLRALLIVGLDSREVLLDDLPRCRAPLTHGVLLLEDRLLDDVEPRRRRLSERDDQHHAHRHGEQYRDQSRGGAMLPGNAHHLDFSSLSRREPIK